MNATATDDNTVAIGANAIVQNSEKVGGLAIGKGANATGKGASAIGTSSVANAIYASAYGDTTKVYAERAIAIGLASNISAGSTNATLLGSHATIGENSVRAVSLGSGNNVSSANATALGSGITIGTGLANSVVLGANSGTGGSHAIANETGATVNGVSYSGFAGTVNSTGNFVSVGTNATGGQRKIINVAAGNVSATSTEAINGSQLYMVANELKNQMGSSSIKYFSVKSTNANNQNNNGASGDNAIAIGPNATAQGNQAIAIGLNSASAAGKANTVAIGNNASVSGDSGTAMGNAARSAKDALALGVLANATAERATAVGPVANALAGNATAVGNQANATSTFATAIGDQAVANISRGVALGAGSVTTRDIATTGGYDILTNKASTITDKTWKANAAAVSVGNATHTRQIVNVAAGSEDTDAVNVAQLKKVVESRADSTRTYTFSIENGASAQANTSGNADTWNLTTNDSLTFGASGDLNVTTDGAGKIVYGLSSTFSDKINTIETTANQAKATADTAKATADTAKATADTAKATADDAKATADTAKATADTAKATADTAKATADTAKATADDAKATADTAKATADDAKATADTAKATANDAKATADTAKATADDAKATADTAKATADDAKATADTAKATADDAKATADDAKAIAGTGKDGKDGSTGTAGAAGQGLTGKDGLNGKDLTTKVNALRNGEAGSVVYTDADGNRLVKANNGQYYPAAQVGEDGEPLAGAKPEANPIASVVNPDGSTTAPTTMGNVKSNIGPNNGAGPITANDAKTAVTDLLDDTTGLNNVATVGDLQAIAQAGLDFTGNNNATTVHRALGTKLTVEGEGSTEAGWTGKSTAANNLYVEADATNNKLVVKMASDLANLTSVAVVDPADPTKSTTLKPTGTTVKDGNKEATYGVDGIGLKGDDGVTTTLGRDKDGNLTVKKGDEPAVALATQGISGNGADAKDGSNGTTGASVTGPTGKDGLNGKDLTTKVNALRNGEAGSVVYTDADGNRLVKANNGQYYPADQVEDNGEPKADATPVKNPIASVVNPDGSTTAPTTMGNVKSTIGLNGKDANGPIGAEAAKNAVAGTDGQSGLLAKKGAELNNAATVGDLQAIAQAGLDFTGNNAAEDKDVHRPLGTKLTIEGETTNANQTKADFGATAANNIHVESKGDENKLVISLTEDLKGINSVDFKPAEITNPDGSTTYAKANISSKGNTYTETDKDGKPVENGKTASYGLNGTEMVETDAEGNKSVSTTTAKGTDIKETAKDGSEKTASYKVGGTELKETAADGTEKAASYKVDGTTLEEVAADGTEKSAEYKVDGSKVTVVDPTTGETKETTMDADGTHATVKDKDGNTTKSADYTADGSTVKTVDPTTGEAKESTYGADGLSTKALDKDGNVTSETTVTPEGVNLYGKDGKDGKDAEPVASLTNKVDENGNNNPSLAFAKDGKGDDAKGTGSVTGLKDIERNLDGTAKDRTAAANAGYVDDRLKEMNDGKPFEYFDKDGNQVVRGKDGNFYDPKDLEGKVYDTTAGKYYPAKADGTADTAQTPVKGKPASEVVIKAMPNEAGPVAMGNVGSGLGLEAYNGKPGADGKTVPAKYDATNADNVKAAQGAADKLYALDGDKLNNVVTAGDLQALAVAGLDFTGNNNATTVHRALGSKLTVEGEGAWNGQNSAANNLYVQADAANNKLVVKMNENLTGINSVDFKPTEITNPDGSKTYAKASMSSAGNTYVETDKDGKAVPNGKSATYGLNGSTLADGKGNVTDMTAAGTNVVDAAGNSATYGANGSKVADAAGNTANYGANGLTVADKDGNPAITLVNNASGPSLNFAKNADGTGTGKITGVAAGDITPDSTDVVTGAQVYALSGGNNVTINPADGSTTSTAKDKDGNIIMTTDENGNQVEKQYTLTTYNVEGQTEFVTNSVITAVHNMNEQGIKFFHTNDDKVTPVDQTGPNGIDSSASGAYATAVGYQATASGTNALAMGKGATVTGENSIAIGTGNQVAASKSGAFGDPNIIMNTTSDNVVVSGSYAIGNDNVINSSNTFVLGNDVNNKLDANGKITGQAAGNTVENSVYLGNKSTATAGDGSATGTLKNLKQDGTQGSTTTAGSTGTVSTAKVGNMTYGGFAGAKADGVVSVGAAGNERRVQNVAAGEISATSTDAINGSQLYSVAKGVDQLDGKVNRMNRKLRSGIAAATAMTNIPQVTLPGKSALGAGVGSYDGQGALAVGYSRMSDNGRIILKLSAGASTQGKYNAGAGVAVQW
ncbi:YadA domain-containing protein [Actinobacillus porcinus]|uniref:YadA domain-containing protein n=1 Tax=Actinobacillus porcinus TaxID=51048 RepID=A0ABY6TI29_9PAST|nr:YadA-like family protein [Actinobacillus porcinus]VFY92365.1 YadA domain-containing protein [Actinobacillus porcinus]VTU06367.1 YadA domain-containing protein [Actinobacillus porcinus]